MARIKMTTRHPDLASRRTIDRHARPPSHSRRAFGELCETLLDVETLKEMRYLLAMSATRNEIWANKTENAALKSMNERDAKWANRHVALLDRLVGDSQA